MTSEFESIVSQDFLEYVFSREVDSFIYNIATKPGENYLSCIYRVIVNFKKENGSKISESKSILVKCYPEKESTRKFLDGGLMFPTEYFIYDQFIPSLNELVNIFISDNGSNCNSSLMDEVGINLAGFYGGNIVGRDQLSSFDKKPWTNFNFLILEDLRASKFAMLDGRKGLDLDHCLLVIHQLANIHALSWVYKQKNGIARLVDRFEYLHDDQFKKGDEARWRSHFQKVNDESLDVIKDKFGTNSDIFIRFKSLLSHDTVTIFMDFLSTSGINESSLEALLRNKPDQPIPEPMEPWLVATHGDCYINNILFSYDEAEPGKPSKVVLIDHQTFREACLTTELAYFIYSSTKPCVRKEIVTVLLKTYFEKFTRIINAVGGKPPVGFTYETFQRRWRRARVFALLMFLQLVPFVYKPVENRSGDVNKDNMESESTPPKAMNNEQDEWKSILIETVLQEYNDGIL